MHSVLNICVRFITTLPWSSVLLNGERASKGTYQASKRPTIAECWASLLIMAAFIEVVSLGGRTAIPRLSSAALSPLMWDLPREGERTASSNTSEAKACRPYLALCKRRRDARRGVASIVLAVSQDQMRRKPNVIPKIIFKPDIFKIT